MTATRPQKRSLLSWSKADTVASCLASPYLLPAAIRVGLARGNCEVESLGAFSFGGTMRLLYRITADGGKTIILSAGMARDEMGRPRIVIKHCDRIPHGGYTPEYRAAENMTTHEILASAKSQANNATH